MKKLILLCALCFCAGGTFAQDSATTSPKEITLQNMHAVLEELFAPGNERQTLAARKGHRTKKMAGRVLFNL